MRPRTLASACALISLVALALASAGCGTSASPSPSISHPARVRSRSPFGWLRPQVPPARWPVARIGTGAAMPYPPGWRPFPGDAGTATAVLRDSSARRSHFVGYLNLTPRQGAETLADWASFRVHHNAADANRRVETLDAAGDLRFRTGHGACVRDAYTTSTGADFIELACLVAGSKATSVIVGAAPASRWATMSHAIERAISSFTT